MGAVPNEDILNEALETVSRAFPDCPVILMIGPKYTGKTECVITMTNFLPCDAEGEPRSKEFSQAMVDTAWGSNYTETATEHESIPRKAVN